MSLPRVLLVESLDAAGSDPADARERCSIVRGLRAVVRVAVLGVGRDHPAVGADDAIAASATVAEWDAGPDGLARLRTFARHGRFDLILIAGATPGGGHAARATAIGVPAWWWPSGVARGPGWGARLALGRGATCPPLGLARSAGNAQTLPGLEWSSAGERHTGRGRLALWDGDYLLAPVPLAGDAGTRLLEAFAAFSASASALDLVVLAQPQPAFERVARGLGVGTRVHFVGPAPREAEWAWWMHAAGAVLAGGGAVSGGLIWRGLASGCPMTVARSDGPSGDIGRWLAGQGCMPWAPQAGRGGADLATAFARMLERDTGVREAIANGRARAERQDRSGLSARLAGALPMLARDAAASSGAAVA